VPSRGGDRWPGKRWQTEKAPRLGDDVLELSEALALADDVEEIAIFSGGGIKLMFS
jgi:hypothetical protein